MSCGAGKVWFSKHTFVCVFFCAARTQALPVEDDAAQSVVWFYLGVMWVGQRLIRCSSNNIGRVVFCQNRETN